jgi:hypothetical protein
MKRILLLSIFSLSMCGEINSNNNSNPFSVLGVAPWTSWEHIRSIYSSKKQDFEETKLTDSEWNEINKAYSNIKSIRGIEDDNAKDSKILNFLRVLSDTLFECFLATLKLIVCHYVIYYFYAIYDHILPSLLITFIFKTFCEKMFPHYITSDIRLYVLCTLVFFVTAMKKDIIFKKNRF